MTFPGKGVNPGSTPADIARKFWGRLRVRPGRGREAPEERSDVEGRRTEPQSREGAKRPPTYQPVAPAEEPGTSSQQRTPT